MSADFGVDGVYTLNIIVDQIPLTTDIVSLAYFRILESVIYPLPIATFRLVVDTQLYSQTPIDEGSLVEIHFTPLRSAAQEEEIYNFRTFSVNQTYVAPLKTYQVVLVIDVIPGTVDKFLMLDCFPRSINANSGVQQYTNNNTPDAMPGDPGIFNILAQENGLFPDIDPSNDKQLWQQLNKRGVLWASDVCDHAYLDEYSHFMWAITRDNYLSFANVNIRKTANPLWTFDHPMINTNVGATTMPYSQVQTRITSGVQNHAIAYGTANVSTDFSTGNWNTFNPNTYQALAENLQYDTNQQSTNRVFSLSPNVGNDHDNYNDAHVQNPRYRAMYSTAVRVGTEFPLYASLFEPCNFLYYDQYTQELDDVFTGKYFISQVDTRLGGSNMYRFFELLSDGLGVGAGGTL